MKKKYQFHQEKESGNDIHMKNSLSIEESADCRGEQKSKKKGNLQRKKESIDKAQNRRRASSTLEQDGIVESMLVAPPTTTRGKWQKRARSGIPRMVSSSRRALARKASVPVSVPTAALSRTEDRLYHPMPALTSRASRKGTPIRYPMINPPPRLPTFVARRTRRDRPKVLTVRKRRTI